MKDIEKIQSPDLGCQIQDANPANFAIEQEVAALVGATVPAPTEPSADDARELGAQLLVFLRRALLPIRSALRTAVADIYAHLDSRCTAYTPAGYDPFRLPAGPYDPMRPFVPRTLPNLLTALTAFDSRKISNGSAPSDGIPDGTSLAHILGSRSMVTKIDDDNHGWVCDSVMPNFPNLGDATLRMKSITAANALNNLGASGKVTMPELETITSGASQYNDPMPLDAEEIYAPNLKTSDAIFSQKAYKAKVVEFPELTTLVGRCFYDCTLTGGSPMQRLLMPKVTSFGDTWGFLNNSNRGMPNLILLEVGTNVNLPLGNWNPTNALSSSASDLVEDPTAHPTWNNLQQFLQNFREHIALRLTDNGSGKTLTLSQAVFSAVIEGSSPICDDIKGIIEDKGWKVQDTNNNIFPTT